jgi:rubrerythrin
VGELGEKTRRNLYEAFVGEAKAHRRLLAFARQADEEGYPDVARLFRAVAYAEGVHADAHLRLLGETVVRTTEENLQSSFERESTVSGLTYPRFIAQAEAEGERRAAVVFSHARDAEEAHAALYKGAMGCMLREEPCAYHVCSVCGLVVEGSAPDECPICGARQEKFVRIE